jgi:hypothetical protein
MYSICVPVRNDLIKFSLLVNYYYDSRRGVQQNRLEMRQDPRKNFSFIICNFQEYALVFSVLITAAHNFFGLAYPFFLPIGYVPTLCRF